MAVNDGVMNPGFILVESAFKNKISTTLLLVGLILANTDLDGFTDGLNFDRVLTAQQISNLRLDLLDYYARLDEKYRSVKREIAAATTKSGVKNGKTSGGTKNLLFASEEPDFIFKP